MKLSHLLRVRELLLGSLAALGSAAFAADGGGAPPAIPPENAHLRTPQTSLLILPVALAGRTMPRVSEVVALLLERNGLENIEVGTVSFSRPRDIATWPDPLCDFLRQHPPATDFVLYAEFNGDQPTRLDELRAVLTDARGNVVWMDRKTPADPEFQKTDAREPMTMAVLLAAGLGPQFGLTAETAKGAKPGKFARLMEERSGLPSQEERTALVPRQREFRLARHTAVILVFPVRVRGALDSAGAADLAVKLNHAGIGNSCAVASPLPLTRPRPDPNELRTLWDLAREFRTYLKNNPTGAGYALYADYSFNAAQPEQGYVHFVLCDARGDWVIVDLQNSHQPDYQRLKPVSIEDCGRLVVRRIEHYLARAQYDASDVGHSHLSPGFRGASVAHQPYEP